MRRTKLYIAVAVAAVLALAVCLFVLTRRRPPATPRAGYAEFLPYISIDEAGNPAGLAVQVVQQAAKRTGIVLQWVEVEDAEKALREGLIDLYPIMTVFAERKRSFCGSVPWWESSQSLLSLRERPLKNAAAAVGRRIAIRDRIFETAGAASQLPGALTIPTHGPLKMIGDLCAGQVEGVLLDGRLIYGALLDQPATCANHPLLVVPLPQTALPMATFARSGVRATADRLFAGIDEISLDGTLTTLANQWFALPQQRYVRDRLAERQNRQLNLLYAVVALLFSLLSLWYGRRSFRLRRTARAAWARPRQAELRFECFMAHTPAMALVKDESGRILYCGFATDIVSNGEEALAALERLDYALVLMDCQMPRMDGYAATRELCRRENGARHTPVIALTANAFTADREACLQAGMDDHLAKPVSLRNLGEILDRWCSTA